ncbi:MAG: hypothetical protein P8Y82_12165, partial [Methyloceanibacter sp.]
RNDLGRQFNKLVLFRHCVHDLASLHRERPEIERYKRRYCDSFRVPNNQAPLESHQIAPFL